MVERTVIVDKYRLNYEGLFNLFELYKLISYYFEEKGYDKLEKKNVESVTEEGKFIELFLMPYKKVTDYAKSVIHLRMVITNMKDVYVEKDGLKVKMNQGKIQFVIDAYTETDYEDRWEKKPGLFFIRTLFDKYFYKPFTTNVDAEVRLDFDTLVDQIKGFLNLNKFR